MRFINLTTLSARMPSLANKGRAIFVMALTMILAACSSTPPETDGSEFPVTSAPISTPSNPIVVEDTSSITRIEQPDIPTLSAAEASLLRSRVVYFDFDESKIKPGALAILRAHARYLSSNPNASVRLEGHADERGTREYNIALGERRGNAAAKFLRVNGVANSQIEVISYGEEKPAVFGSMESSYSQNRRVEIDYRSGNP